MPCRLDAADGVAGDEAQIPLACCGPNSFSHLPAGGRGLQRHPWRAVAHDQLDITSDLPIQRRGVQSCSSIWTQAAQRRSFCAASLAGWLLARAQFEALPLAALHATPYN